MSVHMLLVTPAHVSRNYKDNSVQILILQKRNYPRKYFVWCVRLDQPAAGIWGVNQ